MPEADKRPLKVFLCHASQDKPIVRELAQRLFAEGWIDPWLDEKKLLPGQDWRLKIEEAVETSDIVVICLSSNSVSKEGFVQKELRYAREIALEKPDETIFLIPLRLENCETPRGLRFYQWGDYFGEQKDETYSALLESLNLRYEQKLRLEEKERARKEHQEHEIAEKLAREKAEREIAEKVAREKAKKEAQEKAEREAAEKAAREKIEREKAEKTKRENAEHEAAAKLASEKIEMEYERQREKITRDARRQKILIDIRYRLSLIRIYALPIIFALITIAALIFLVFYLQRNIPLLTQALNSTAQPSQISTEDFIPTKTLTPNAESTSKFTPSETAAPSASLDCRYTVIQGDTLFAIAENFGIGGNNWRNIACAPESSGCDLSQPDNFAVGWILIIPGVFENICLQLGGQPDISSTTSMPPEITDAKGVQMLLVSSGNFTMGSNNNDFINENPRHSVELSAYYIDKFEVINGDYNLCVQGGRCEPPTQRRSFSRPDYFGNHSFDKFPVIYVTWQMAKTYCEWRDARLPSEAEWEKAARGTDARIYPWGDIANGTESNYNGLVGDVVEVGTYDSSISPFGLFDMAGNVQEWVSDWYQENYYSTISDGVLNPQGPLSGQKRVLRGGSWDVGRNYVRATFRSNSNPAVSFHNIGFRCAKDAAP